jgi:hypothetical protein
MPDVKFSSNDRAGAMLIFCTKHETELVAENVKNVSGLITPVLHPPFNVMVWGMATIIAMRAKRALRRGKCLILFCCGLVIYPGEYDPNDPEDGWTKDLD